MSSLKANVILNSINTVASIVFPVITFPYAARVLLPDGIGTINFLNSIIGYIVLLTNLGIPLYAVKEIAKYKNSKEKISQITIEILIIGFLLSLLGYVIVWILSILIPEIKIQATLFFILSLTILFTTIGVEWFYKAIEDFKFITVRALIFKTLATIALFIFVHNKTDLLIYGFIVVGSTVGNNFINFIHLRKFIKVSYFKFSLKNVFRHIIPSSKVFVLNLIISLYVSLNSIMLGFLSGEEAVGYFTAGNRMLSVGVTLISSISTVLLPRSVYLLEKGETENYNYVINKSLNLIQILSYPIAVGLIVLARPITFIFCGPEYYPSINVLIIIAPILLFISMTNLMGIQILYPKNKLKLVIYSVLFGAIINLILNLLLIPLFSVIGAAIATFVAELVVFLLQIYLGKEFFPFNWTKIINYNYLVLSLIMGLMVYFLNFLFHELWLKLFMGIVVGIVIYSICLWKEKDFLFLEMLNFIKKKIAL